MKLKEVYEKYKHFDKLLSDTEWVEDNFQGRMLYDFWKSIKETLEVKGVEK